MLKKFFDSNPRFALAYSGGADSSYLLYESVKNGADIGVYYVKTQFQPEYETDSALGFAKNLSIEPDIIEIDILSVEKIAENPPNRCYLCKKILFSAINNAASEAGFEIVADGTNASDIPDSRPGMKSLEEHGIISPLRDAGLSKNDIRRLSKNAGLETWDKPSYSCLATSIPNNTRITPELLTKIEKSESAVRNLGFRDFRVRLSADGVAVAFGDNEIEKALKNRESIETVLTDEHVSVMIGRRHP